jgi:hypothetical protein
MASGQLTAEYHSALLDSAPAEFGMKQVEVAVREAGESDNALIETKLMRQAFKPETGRLSDQTTEVPLDVAPPKIDISVFDRDL